MTIKAPETDDIKAAFPHQTLPKCVGEPNYTYMDLLQNQLIRNCSTVESTLGGGQNGLAGLAEHPAQYQLRTGQPFVRPINPGNNPVYPAAATPAQREQIKNVFNENLRNYLSCQRTETLCLSMLESAIDEIYLGEIWTAAHGFGNRNLLGVLEWLYHIYGHIGPGEVAENQEKLTAPIDPKLPAVHIFKQIEDCNKFATAAGAPFTVQQCLKAAEQLVLKQGRYGQAYREYFALPPINKTYLEFKRRILEEYSLQNQINTQAGDMEYANATHTEPTDDDPLIDAVQRFAQANAAETTAFQTLAQTNRDLNEKLNHLSIANATLQQQLSVQQQPMPFSNPPQPPAYTTMTEPPTVPPPIPPTPPMLYVPNTAYSAQAPPPPPPQLPRNPTLPPAAAYPAPMQPPGAPYQYNPGRGGRGRGRTRGGRGGRQPQQPRYQQPPPIGVSMPPPYNQQGMTPQYQQQRPPTRRARNPPFSNPVKYYNNWNYCHTCGFDVEDWHTSQTCPNPGPYHQMHATRSNPMNGCKKAAHKNQLPTQE